MGGMANVGLDNQHMQGKEDDVTTSESKTYIGSNGKRKVAMNKIKNTKIGDDIHYYINGIEGRGIVIKMGNEFLQVFGDDRKINNIHINDTFFVKDILINKQWNDMDDTERYEALQKIHAPTPRFIAKGWEDLPPEIKELLRKEGGNMAGGTGSTYEEGESKDSETKDHARTGFAQNTQYSKKGELDYSLLKAADKEAEHYYRRKREKEEKETGKMKIGNPDYYTIKNPKYKGDKSKIPMPYMETDFATGKETIHHGKGRKLGYERELRHARRKFHKDNPDRAAEWQKAYEAYDKKETERETATASQAKEGSTPKASKEVAPKMQLQQAPKKEKPKKDKPSGGFVQDLDEFEAENKSVYKHWLEKKSPRPNPRRVGGERGASFGTTQSEAGQESQQKFRDTSTAAAGAVAGALGGSASSDTTPISTAGSTGAVGGSGSARHQAAVTRGETDAVLQGEYTNFITKPIPDGKGGKGEFAHCVSVNQDKDDPKAFCGAIQNATEKKKENNAVLRGEYDTYKSEQFRKIYGGKRGKKKSEDTVENEGAKEAAKRKEAESGDTILNEGSRGKPVGRITHRDGTTTPVYADEEKEVSARFAEHKKNPGKRSFKKSEEAEHGRNVRDNIIIRDGQEATNVHRVKSDVEHGKLGNVGSTPEVAVSTDTKVDVTEGTGYEERPHISVEEAGKLPRSTFNESGSELTVSGSQDSKDEPKFSQPHSQDTVRKVGLPQQHPNTYGVRYGMKGGVKKVWCPEHQMWEETRKDWHEDK